MKPTKSLFSQLHDANEEIKRLKLIIDKYKSNCNKCNDDGEVWSEPTHPTHDNSKLIKCNHGNK
jgi:hypothetical protein